MRRPEGSRATDLVATMLYGFYESAQGANIETTRLDVIANNLANSGTTAFKRDLAVFQAHAPFDVANATGRDLPNNLAESNGGTTVSAVATDYSQGSLTATGNDLDLAIEGPGFFILSEGGQQYLTRNGQFTIDGAGQIVSTDTGLPVAGVSAVPPAVSSIHVGSDGVVSGTDAAGGVVALGQVEVVVPESTSSLVKLGSSLYTTDSPLGKLDTGSVRQGFVESSSVEPTTEMANMIAASRAFESNLNLLRIQDESLSDLLRIRPHQ